MDDFFNHDVAEWIYDSVSKMDDDEAEMFARFFVYEVHKADIDNNRRTLDRHVEEVNKRVQAAAREVISKDDGTNFFDAHGQNQPRAHDGRWVKIEIGGKPRKAKKTDVIRDRPSATRPTSYREDAILLNVRGKEIDLSNALLTAGERTNAFSNEWTARGPRDHSTNERTYRRVQAGAQLLSALPNDKAKLAGAVAGFAGEFGPEAEKVIGPAARRTTYRYRGTERMPDEKIHDQHDIMLDQMARRSGLTSTSQITPELRMAAGEAAGVGYLRTRIPRKDLSTLQRESGKLPPSEGVIINSNGDIVTQAVGYNEDHYLPFNLKNLKGLKGGAYVRTRSSGGLTSEDIYTGLVAGARSVTVVSRSGVFTLDFEDDLRGGRRYSDKARQMVGRYAQTLDAVQSEKVARRGLDPGERAAIREEVEAETQGWGLTPAQIQARITAKEKEFQSGEAKLTKDEIEAINYRAMEAAQNFDPAQNKRQPAIDRLPDDPKKRILFFRSKMMDDAIERKKARMYQLDAEGYHSAMQALEEQFPYYVQNVNYSPLPDKSGELKPSTEKDTGYVRPRYNRPEKVRAGYYDENITGKGKFSAADLHYQNHFHRIGESDAGETQASEETTAAGKKTPKQVVHENIARRRAEEAHKASVKTLLDTAGRVALSNRASYKTLARYADSDGDITKFTTKEIEDAIREAKVMESQSRIAGQAEGKEHLTGIADSLKPLIDAAERTSNALSSRELFKEESWDPRKAVSKVPQRMGEGPEYTPNAEDPSIYATRFDAILKQAQSRGDLKNISASSSDADMMKEEKIWQDIYAEADDAIKMEGPAGIEAATKLSTLIAEYSSEDQAAALFDDYLEGKTEGLKAMHNKARENAMAVKRLRAIKSNAGENLTPKELPSGTIAGEVVSAGDKVVARNGDAIKTPAAQNDAQKKFQALLDKPFSVYQKKVLNEIQGALVRSNSSQVEAALDNAAEMFEPETYAEIAHATRGWMRTLPGHGSFGDDWDEMDDK